MSITAEQYTAAMNASDLTDIPHKIVQVDLIKASGMSKSSVGAHYLRLISKPSRADIERMHAALVRYGIEKKLATVHDAVVEAINWLIDQRCKPCQGTGLMTKEAKAYTCTKCKGVMKAKEPSNKDAQFLIDYVMYCKGRHMLSMRKLLRR